MIRQNFTSMQSRVRIAFLALTLLALAGPGSVWSQTYFDPNPWASGRSVGTRSIALGDVDRDGDLDLVCGSGDSGPILYRNTGGIFEDEPAVSSSTDFTYSVALGDVDGDGDLDLVCGNYESSPTLYRNTDGVFEDQPAWAMGRSDRTFCVALGDVDGDGDLDLVCGNAGTGSTLYRNVGGVFENQPVWESERIDNTAGVALGDVDGDDDLDLICGNFRFGSTMYRNVGGTFENQPAWNSGRGLETHSVSVGDVDGDGDLDVVLGNFGASPALFRNIGDTFEDVPAWVSGRADSIASVALGDVDDDGDLDLVCGDYRRLSPKLYRNTAGTFENSPVWESGRNDHTLSIALSDVDGDGGLDLVCGNYFASPTFYRGVRGVLEQQPAWSTGRRNVTYSIALGDVDGDADLDLVCGNYGQSPTLYRITGGTPEDAPVWSTGRGDLTKSVALGDVDRDGDLDLVCGNFGQSPTLYRNTGDTFEDLPVWAAGRADSTTSIALGDIDGDENLDLVCGNFGSGPTLYHRNTSGAFENDPAWSSARRSYTRSVALGDVDGNGGLDLVCGTSTGPMLYRNVGGRLEDQPIWVSERGEDSNSVALGDVDGDGDLDLVCGTNSSPTYYRNAHGTFEDPPTWDSGATARTQSVGLWDVDADGDLDLVCGNLGLGSTMYRNVGGTFEDEPAWTSGQADNTYSVALGDVDRDGDSDVVFGNTGSFLLGKSPTLYRSTAALALRGNPQSPTNHLPNSDGVLTRMTLTPDSTNIYRVGFTVVDVESDAIWIVPEYQFRGAPWNAIPVLGPSSSLGPLASSPDGIYHEFLWDVTMVPIDERPAALRLRAVSFPNRVGISQRIGSYILDIGRIETHHPTISLQAALAFGTMTMGSTASDTLSIANTGNRSLQITAIDVPASLGVSVTPPLMLQSGQEIEAVVTFHPSTVAPPTEELRIFSDDPIRPVVEISVHADLHPLAVQSRVLVPNPAPLGEAATVQAIPPDSITRIEGAYLHYRVRGAASFDTNEMRRFGLAWVAAIPGASVRETGVEYYVEIRNGDATAFDPPQGPIAPSSFDVAAPITISTRPRVASSTGFAVPIEVVLPHGTDFVSGELHYRQLGDTTFTPEPLSVDREEVLLATVPAGQVTERGLEYWVDVRSRNARLTYPALPNPASAPDTIRVKVQRLELVGSHAARRYRMITIPLDYGSHFAGTINTILGLGPYLDTEWRIYRYIDDAVTNVELLPRPIDMPDTRFIPVPARAFWVVTRVDQSLDTGLREGLSTARPESPGFPLSLQHGWNQFGNPYAFPVAWESVLRSSSITDLYRYEPTRLPPEDPWISLCETSVLQPYDGYLVYCHAESGETIFVPAVAAPTASPSCPPLEADKVAHRSLDSWRLGLQAHTSRATDGANVFGVDSHGHNERDGLDHLKPPSPPGSWVNLAFVNRSWPAFAGAYGEDVRAPNSDGHAWTLEVRSDTRGEEIVLEWFDPSRGAGSLPADLAMALVDQEQGSFIPLVTPSAPSANSRSDQPATDRSLLAAYHVLSLGPERAYRMTLLAGTAEYVSAQQQLTSIPLRTTLDQNAPNPFNATTRVRFGLAAPGHATLHIYNVRGELVTTLQNGTLPAGYHSVLWNSKDSTGHGVASGVYLCRLVAGETAITRRLVLVE